jgi:hypothetical protein
MLMMNPGPSWRKSSYSNSTSNCVEVAGQPDTVAVRDTKDPDGPALAFSRLGWREFTRRIRKGAADLA